MNSMPTNPLDRQMNSIFAANREKSNSTQRGRAIAIRDVAARLTERFGLQKWDNLGQKHVDHVVNEWKAEDQGKRAINTKLSHLRWFLKKLGKPTLLPRSNKELGIESGARHTRAGKTVPDDYLKGALAKVGDARIEAMIHLGRELGLRFEEAALLRPHRDFDGQRVWIKRGTKGGRPRYMYLHRPSQREAIARAQALTNGDGCLIPKEFRTYEQFRQHVYNELGKAGIGKETDHTFHDLRRTYITERMKDLVYNKGMSRERAAQLVAREVGHNRTEVLRWYLAG